MNMRVSLIQHAELRFFISFGIYANFAKCHAYNIVDIYLGAIFTAPIKCNSKLN